mgnify:CR=1 FL=1
MGEIYMSVGTRHKGALTQVRRRQLKVYCTGGFLPIPEDHLRGDRHAQ